jgi:formate hydrogenlyase subunit 3/multisubunit Na+/H+ antiporter MnhD subunit
MFLGMGLLLAGLAFKIAAFPFHMWVPDTYEAATTPFVAWLAVAPKAAGFVAIIRLFVEGGSNATAVWMPVVAALAGVTIIAGNLMAIPQRNIKRLLAYSGVAHIGYMLIGLAALSSSGVAMLLFYLVAYLFGNIGAFMVVEVVARSEQSDGIDAYRGLAQRSPLLALSMLIFLLSLGGIPFVAGFWAKLYVFLAAVEQGLYGLVLLGAVLTAPTGPGARSGSDRRGHRDMRGRRRGNRSLPGALGGHRPASGVNAVFVVAVVRYYDPLSRHSGTNASLLYISPDSQDMHEQSGTVPGALTDAPYESLCPGSAELAKLQESFR